MKERESSAQEHIQKCTHNRGIEFNLIFLIFYCFIIHIYSAPQKLKGYIYIAFSFFLISILRLFPGIINSGKFSSLLFFVLLFVCFLLFFFFLLFVFSYRRKCSLFFLLLHSRTTWKYFFNSCSNSLLN